MMVGRDFLARMGVDPYLFALAGAVALAALVPARGPAEAVAMTPFMAPSPFCSFSTARGFRRRRWSRA